MLFFFVARNRRANQGTYSPSRMLARARQWRSIRAICRSRNERRSCTGLLTRFPICSHMLNYFADAHASASAQKTGATHLNRHTFFCSIKRAALIIASKNAGQMASMQKSARTYKINRPVIKNLHLVTPRFFFPNRKSRLRVARVPSLSEKCINSCHLFFLSKLVALMPHKTQ